jgi:methionyl aminopeptidase
MFNSTQKNLNDEYNQMLSDLRKSAEIHKQVRKYAQSIMKPGVDLLDFCNKLENKNKELSNSTDYGQGIGFPTGVSINNCAAHFTPTIGDKIQVKKDDVIKIDFGTHINGRIIDSAFTQTFNPKYDKLLEAVKDATNTGIKEAGIDVELGYLGEKIQEVMESYEIELDGETYPIKSVRNLGGHNIEPYKIHGGKFVPCIKTDDNTRMEEGEVFAIETFGTTGSGIVKEYEPTSHFMKNDKLPNYNLKLKSSKKLFGYINKKFNTLPFCDKWLQQDKAGCYHKLALEELCNQKIITKYPPLYDVKGSYVAQFEHTIILKPSGKEVLSRGEDY